MDRDSPYNYTVEQLRQQATLKDWAKTGVSKEGVIIRGLSDVFKLYGNHDITKLKDDPGFRKECDKVFKKDTMIKKVYEYVAYYIAPKTELDKTDGKRDAIILDSKLIAESEDAAKTKVIRLVPTEWENDFSNITIAVRAFR